MTEINGPVFALFQESTGLRMTTTYKNPRELLQVLLGVCEDLREANAVEAIKRDIAVHAAKSGGLIGR